MKDKNLPEESFSILSKQQEAINICYDRLLEVLRETTNEATIIKCIETIRKDMSATIPANGRQNVIQDTYDRIAEIEKQLKKL